MEKSDIAKIVLEVLNEKKSCGIIDEIEFEDISNSISSRILDGYRTLSIVLAHANTDFRRKILGECLDSLVYSKIFLSTNYPVGVDIQNKCDYFIFSKDNPLLMKDEFSKYGLSYYKWWTKDGIRYEESFEYEHGYAVYDLIKKGLMSAIDLYGGDSTVNIINYDYVINQKTISDNLVLLSSFDIVFYRYESDVESYSTGFISGRISALMSFFSEFSNKDEYYSNSVGFNTLERKMYSFYKDRGFKIKEIDFGELKSECSVDREYVFS